MYLLWYCSVVHKELESHSVTVGKGHAHRQCQWHQKTIVAIARKEVCLQVLGCEGVDVWTCAGVRWEGWRGEVWTCAGVRGRRGNRCAFAILCPA